MNSREMLLENCWVKLLGFGLDKVFMDVAEILFAPTRWGLRLAWSRLVDLGSIDSGSNPGGPTIFNFLGCALVSVVAVATSSLVLAEKEEI